MADSSLVPLTFRSSFSEPAAAERKRWLVLAALMWVGFNQGMAWMTFSASPIELRELLPHTTIPNSEIDLLLNWGPIMYLVACLPFMARMTRRGPAGVYECVLGAGILIFLGCFLRLAAFLGGLEDLAHYFLHAGQIVLNSAGPVSAAIAPAFAATWFPVGERTLATALVWTSQSVAPTAGFLVALPTKSGSGLLTIMVAEASSAFLACALWLFAVPKLPRLAPSPSAAAHRESSRGNLGAPSLSAQLLELWEALGRNRFGLLAVAGGVAVGAFQNWSSSLGVLFADSPFVDFANGDVGKLLGFVTNGGAFVGTVVAPLVADRYFQYRFKPLLLIVGWLQALLLAAFTLAVPGGEGKQPLVHMSSLASLIVLFIASVLNGLGGPVCFELGAELTYPSLEGISSTAYSFSVNGAGFLLMTGLSLAGTSINGVTSCALMSLIIGCCMVALAFVPETYPRLRLDIGEQDDGTSMNTASCQPGTATWSNEMGCATAHTTASHSGTSATDDSDSRATSD